jgi:hypothetical protein
MGYKSSVLVAILFLIFLGLYAIGFIPGYWTLMIAVIFIVVGFVVGILLLGSGEERMWTGIPMLLLGILLLLIVWFFPR